MKLPEISLLQVQKEMLQQGKTTKTLLWTFSIGTFHSHNHERISGLILFFLPEGCDRNLIKKKKVVMHDYVYN